MTSDEMKDVEPRATVRMQCAFGWFEVSATERGIVRTTLPTNGNRSISFADPDSAEASEDAVALAHQVATKIQRFFAGEDVALDEPLDLSSAPDFFVKVWTELRNVPRGETISYGDLARRAGKPGAARAVGMAMANNPVPVIVPCHRVIRSDGSIGGFGGGLALKRRMLELEVSGLDQRIRVAD